ncbi:MAG TPA: alpha/beta hydrolase [Ktedonobacterales bacterium]|jgi:pimeloyl-ACP methyl ester carboxylesterase
MSLVLSDELFDAQMLRALGHSPYGGADIGECISTAERIKRVDVDLWYAEWLATARRVHELAERSAARGDTISAREAYFRASNYYRTAGIFLMGVPVDARLLESHRLEVETFRRAAALLEIPPDIIEIPFEHATLPAYFFRAKRDGLKRPTLILTTGYDGTAEELYFANAVAALRRGYNVLAFDGPGQGSVLLDQGIPFRPDWETVVQSVVDVALTLPEVEKEKLALLGWSFGGYLAPRAATGEHRLAACIADCGPYDLFASSMERIPPFLARPFLSGNRLAVAALRQILRRILKRPSGGWSLRRILLVHGITDPLEFFSLARDYTLKGREQMIQCPTFVCTAEDDDLSAKAPLLYNALTCPKKFVLFKRADGAGAHCEMAARTLFHQEAFDWLDAALASKTAQIAQAV